MSSFETVLFNNGNFQVIREADGNKTQLVLWFNMEYTFELHELEELIRFLRSGEERISDAAGLNKPGTPPVVTPVGEAASRSNQS